MGVTYIAPAGTVTSPAKLITKNITDNGTYDAADDLANGYSKVTVNVEGGGSSLPTPLATNLGDIVNVQKKYVEGETLIAEQTVTMVEVPDSDPLGHIVGEMDIENGKLYYVTLDENTYSVVGYNDGYDAFLEYGGEDYSFDISGIDGELYIWTEASTVGDTHTLKIAEATEVYDYALDKYAQYDIVIESTAVDTTLSHYTPIKYDYDSIHQKVLNGELVTGILFYHWNYDESVDGDTDVVLCSLVKISITFNAGFLDFCFYNGSSKFSTQIEIDVNTGEFLSVSKTNWT